MPETVKLLVNPKTGKTLDCDVEKYNSWPQHIKDQFPKVNNVSAQSEPVVFEFEDRNT